MNRFASGFSEELKGKLKKFKKKNRVLFEAALGKIREIEGDPERYKPLRYELSGHRRVHLVKSFVLIFRVDAMSKRIVFEDLEHHDRVYRN